MKITRILAGLISLSLLTGCAGNESAERIDPASDEQTQVIETDVTEESAPSEEISQEVPDTVNARLSVMYSYNVVSLVLQALSIDIKVDDVLYFRSGDIAGEKPKEINEDEWNRTCLTYMGEKTNLDQEDMDEIRGIYIDFYQENLADDQQSINDFFCEFASSMTSSEDFDKAFNCTDKVKCDFILHIGDSDIPIHADKCEVRSSECEGERGDKPHDNIAVGYYHDAEKGTVEYVTGMLLEYDCVIENADKLLAYASDVHEAASDNPETYPLIYKDFAAMEKGTSNAAERGEAGESASEDQTAESDSGILGKWYPEYSDFAEYYIQFNEDGTGCICIDGDETALTYTFSDGVIRVKVSTGGSNEFYVEGSNLREDFDGTLYSRKTTADQQAEKDAKEPAAITDVTGTWYDPTGYSTSSFTFNADGTGYLDWGTKATPASITYTVSKGAVNISMSDLTFTLKIRGDQLDDGESRYIRK